MGFLGHPDMVSILSYSRELTGFAGLLAHMVYPLDREGLLAAYNAARHGRSARKRTPEARAVVGHLHPRPRRPRPSGRRRGGVRRGSPQRFRPAMGLRALSLRRISEQSRLSGSARWAGRLLGLTPSAEVVAGATGMTVNLATLNGSLNFTSLESWQAGAAPGSIGTGTRWGDGDLGYSIAVDGNTFIQTGGDDGVVTGAFFGAAHEAMGGTLDRDDLAAGFGGTR